MKAKIVTTILMALFLVILMAFNSSPAMAIDFVPIVDGDVVPFGIPPSPPRSTWDTTQIGLVVERGNGFIDVGLPAPATPTWGIHGLITFHEVSVITVKDWDNEGNLGNMDTHGTYGLEGGDDGDAYIGTINYPITNRDEVDWTTGGTAVEFWVATLPARDFFRIELDYLSVAASMKIEYVNGYRVSSAIYGLGPQSPVTTYSYGEWLPLVLPSATVDVDPDTLNLKSNGEWVSAYIELPAGYDVANIDVGSIVLAVDGGDFYVDPAAPTAIGDYDLDGVSDLMVKFNRAAIRDHLIGADVDTEDGRFYEADFAITGTVDTTTFLGTDTVRVRVP